MKDDINATAGEMLQAAVDARVDELATMARAEEQKMALTTAAGMIDTSDLSTADDIADANDDIAALQQALDEAVDVSDADKAMYQSQLDTAKTKVATAQNNLDTETRRTEQMGVLMTASGTLETALAALSGEPTQEQIDTVQTAVNELNAAIEAGADLTVAEKNSYTTAVANAESRIDQAKKTLMANNDRKEKDRLAREKKAEEDREAKEEADADARAETGKALYKALTANPLNFLDDADAVALTDSGLAVNPNGAADDPAGLVSVSLKAGDSAGSLGSWSGTNYAHTDSVTKVVNEAVVYTNRASPNVAPFPYTLTDGTLTVDVANIALVMAIEFTHSGTQTHEVPDRSNAVYIRGTYDGAPGEYSCGTDCTSTNDGKGSPSALGGTWTFKPDAGAMVSQPDANYLYYGWWVRKDKDGDPTEASAFAGVAGTIAALAADPVSAISGSATYSGHAAGKFAMSNPLDGTGDGGHFTADATLTAKFGANAAPNNGGVSGTIDNFMANDKSVPWSVTLNRAPWGTNGAFATPNADDTNTEVDESKGTVWTIDGRKADASGAWSGQMYDEKPGNPGSPTPGDGSNVPTTVTGTFYSEFSSFGRLVGAFGAEKQ